jgi:hypothetical protein
VIDQAAGINRSTVIDFHQSRESRFAQPVRLESKVYVEPGTDAGIRNVNGIVRVQSKPGSAAELGDTSGLGIRVEAGALELTSTSVRILSGSGAPTDNAPNGSIYL